jgi:hypothetical protein
MGRTTPEVKRAAKKTIQKPLQDRVQAKRDALTKRITDRSALRGSKKAQRQAMATGGETTGSLRKGNLEFPGDRTGATRQAKSDIDFKKQLKALGATGDFSPTFSGSKRAAAQAKRDQRMSDLGVDDKSLGKYSKLPTTTNPFADYVKKQKAAKAEMDKKYPTGTRDLSTMNPDELRRRGIGGDGSGSTEGSAGASGSTAGAEIRNTGKDIVRTTTQTRNPNYNQFQDLSRRARKDANILSFERDKLRNPEGMDKKKIKATNKQVRGALDAEKRYRDAAKGSKSSAIVPMTKDGSPTPIATYLQKDIPQSPSLISKIGKFTQKNPVLGGVGALAGLDAVRGGAEQIGKLLSPGNIGLRGGRVGRRSARQ